MTPRLRPRRTRLSLSGVSTPMEANSRATYRAAGAFMCTRSASSMARTASASDMMREGGEGEGVGREEDEDEEDEDEDSEDSEDSPPSDDSGAAFDSEDSRSSAWAARCGARDDPREPTRERPRRAGTSPRNPGDARGRNARAFALGRRRSRTTRRAVEVDFATETARSMTIRLPPTTRATTSPPRRDAPPLLAVVALRRLVRWARQNRNVKFSFSIITATTPAPGWVPPLDRVRRDALRAPPPHLFPSHSHPTLRGLAIHTRRSRSPPPLPAKKMNATHPRPADHPSPPPVSTRLSSLRILPSLRLSTSARA